MHDSKKSSTFEHLPWLAHFPRLSQSQFPRSYVRSSQPIHKIARNILQKRFDLIIRYPTLRFQASLSECCIAYEIDKSIFFCKYFSLYLRMCIFCCTSNICFGLPISHAFSHSQFPRSYFREMQPILQIARNICKNGLTLSSATQHFAFKRT